MREHLPAFRRHLNSSGRAERTINTYEAIAASFFAFAQRPGRTGPILRSDVEAFLGRPRRDGLRRAAAGRNQELAALRSFVKFAQRNLDWTTNPVAEIEFAREPPHDPAVLTVPELRRLFTVAAESPGSSMERARDLAIVAVLSHAALRVHELVALDLGLLDFASATLVAVKGKGGTVHDLPLNAATVTLLSAWLAERAAVATEGEQALFVSSRGTRVSVRTVERLFVRLRLAMGTAKKITPHTLRHSCATAALTLGSDLSTVAELLRHADLNTTRKYLHLIDERRRDAVRRLESTIPKELLPRPRSPIHQGIREGRSARDDSSLENSGTLDDQYGLDDIGKAA